MGNKILIVEDERTIVEILKFNLGREGYEVLEALDGETGLELARAADPDLVLLDVMLPRLGGFELCRTLRGEGNPVPVIMLTAREEENDKVSGLEAGADDYITKPFSMRELLARVKANIRRRALDSGSTSGGEGLVLNAASYGAYKNGAPVDLTQKEFDLLRFLMASPDHVFSREELMEKVWNYGYYGDMRTVDVTVRRLREKIEDNPGKPRYILTRRGVGYYYQSQ